MCRMNRAAACLVLAAVFFLTACAASQAEYYVGFSLSSLYVGGEAVSARERAAASSALR